MSTFSERFAELCKISGKTQQSFADSIGIAERTYRTYRDGAVPPIIETLGNINRKYNVSFEWLLLGEGPIFRDQEPTTQVRDTNVNILGIQNTSGNLQNAIQTTDTPEQLMEQIRKLQATIDTLLATNAKLVDKVTSI